MEVEDTGKILQDLLAKLTQEEKQRETKRKAQEKPRLIHLGLREREAEAWLDQEPNYDKNILRSSDGFIHHRRSAGDYTEPRGRYC